MKIVGIVPARMASSRFPGKPLHPIVGRPMLEHCYRRAALYDSWDRLVVATCDREIQQFCEASDMPAIMTADTHTRALDRVAEAADKCGVTLGPEDVVVCVQADEPMLGPDVIEAVIKPFLDDPSVRGTLLGMQIVDEDQYRNPDIVKVVHDRNGDVLYTSRSPIPWCKSFSPELGARRIGGIFGFRRRFLDVFASMAESPLEIVEACDSNRFCDNGLRQRVAPVPYRPYFSVDSPADAVLVEKYIRQDPWWGKY